MATIIIYHKINLR